LKEVVVFERIKATFASNEYQSSFISQHIGIVSYICFGNREMFHKLLFSPYTINREKQWYRFLSSAWVHADMTHLFFNLFVLYSFGNFLEAVFQNWFGTTGSLFYLFLFSASTLIAHLPSYYKHKDNFNYSAVGSSGGVSGVLFATILLQPLGPLYLFAIIPIPGIVFGVLYLVYSKYMAIKGLDNIGQGAHIWGSLGGMAILIIFQPQVVVQFLEQLASIFI